MLLLCYIISFVLNLSMSFFMPCNFVIVTVMCDVMLILSSKMRIKVKENRNEKIIEND